MSPTSKIALRRIDYRKRAKTILESLDQGTGDVYERYRGLYALWCHNSAAVQELGPLFRIPGIEPDGAISVTDDFKRIVRSLAAEILPLFLEPKVHT